jgi:hypothetical protein
MGEGQTCRHLPMRATTGQTVTTCGFGNVRTVHRDVTPAYHSNCINNKKDLKSNERNKWLAGNIPAIYNAVDQYI